MNCLFCGIELTRKTQKKYCSVSCQKAHRSVLTGMKRIRTCKWCGKEFVMRWPSGKARKGEANEGQFCSRKCKGLAKRNKLTCPVYVKECSICGKWFTSRHQRARCSDECTLEYNRLVAYKRNSGRQVITKICKECGNEFTPEYGCKKRIFCSDMCSKKNGRRKCKGTRRAKKRGNGHEAFDPIDVLRRDKWRCQLCGVRTPKKLRGTWELNAPELDHIVPLSMGGEHSMRNSQCLCRKCNSEKGATTRGQLRLFG